MSLFNIFESLVRIVLFFSGLFQVIPALNSIFPKEESLELQFIEIVLGVFNVVFLIIFLTNLTVTAYTPFGRAVSSSDSFLTCITGYNTRIVVFIIGNSFVMIKNPEDSYNFTNNEFISVLNETAYKLGEGEFFNDIALRDDVGDILINNLFFAQNALFFSGLVFAGLYFVEKNLIGVFENKQIGGSKWIVTRWYQSNPGLLGYPRRGPAIRNTVAMLFAGAAGLLEITRLLTVTNEMSYQEIFACAVFIFNCAFFVVTCLTRVLDNVIRRRLSPLLVFDILIILYLWLYAGLYVLRIALPGLDKAISNVLVFAYPIVMILVYVVTFNTNLFVIGPLTIADIVKFFIVNLAKDNINKFFRMVWSISLVAGILGLFFAYYAFIGNAFEFKFSSGEFVEDITAITDDVEEKFDRVVESVNAFLVAVTPCTELDSIYASNPNEIRIRQPDGTVVTYDAPTPNEIKSELQSNSYFAVCFDNNDWDLPFSDSRCTDPYNNYLDAANNQSQFSQGSLPVGVEYDDEFVDDDQLPVSFDVIKVDPNCFNILCVGFTVLMGGLFAVSLIPFANIAAVIASKAARVAWRISRIGQRMIKYARKMYAKRRKLTRFIKLLKKLSAVGAPTMKFNIAVAFIFVPTVLTGVFAILLAFFKRDITDRGDRNILQQTSARRLLLTIFLGLTLLNLLLFVGFFGFAAGGTRSADIVGSMLESLPQDLIIAQVSYGIGMRYLRYTLIVSIFSSGFFSVSLGVEKVYLTLFGPRKRYAQIADDFRYKETPKLENSVSSLIVAFFFIIPVLFFGWQCFGNEECRMFGIYALQDEKLADVAESIANSEIITDSAEIIKGDVDKETERSCGIVSVAVEPLFDLLLDALDQAFSPLYESLTQLRTEAARLIGAVRFDNIFAAIDLNFPYSALEYWIIFTLPYLYVVLLTIDIVLTSLYTWVSKRQSFLSFANYIETVLLYIGIISFEITLTVFALFSSIGGLNVPLFNIRVDMGLIIEYGLYASIFCILASISLYFNKLLPII